MKNMSEMEYEFVQLGSLSGMRLVIPYIETELPKHLYMAQRYIGLFKNCSKVYAPVHLIVLLIRLKNSKAPVLQTLKRFFLEFLKSNLFSTVFAMSIPTCYCYLNKIFSNPNNSGYGMLVSFTFSTAILFETPNRWSEMSLYVLAQWFQGYTFSLNKRKMLIHIPQWHRWLMSLAMGLLSYVYFKPSSVAKI